MKRNSKYAETYLMLYGVVLIFAGISGYAYTSRLTLLNQHGDFWSLYGLYIAGALFGIVLLGVSFHMSWKRKKELQAELKRTEANLERARLLASDQAVVTAEEFLSLSGAPEFTGVYILHNATKDMYYVGQSVRVMQRVRQHLTGHGNGDVYADYKNGDSFTVRTISMSSSGYLSIDDLERDMIEAHDAYDNGYNRQRGNGRR